MRSYRRNEAKDTDSLIHGRQSRRVKSLSDYDVDDRLGFIRKVYAILSVQLIVTFGAIAMTKSNEQMSEWMSH